MSPSQKPEPFISISESSIVRTNLGFVLTMLGLIGAGILGWATTKSSLDAVDRAQKQHSLELKLLENAHSARMSALEGDWRSTREVLIRIDERTEQMRREQTEIKERMKALSQ